MKDGRLVWDDTYAAPIILRVDHPLGNSHWCNAVGSRVHAPKDECPAKCYEEQDD